MRSNRPNYASTPAGSSKALDRKPRPKRSKREWNQLMLMVFFIILPVIGLLAVFFQPVRWMFMLLVIAALAVMWLIRAFLFPGRLILSAVYGLALIFTLVTALSAGTPKNRVQQHTDFLNTTSIPVSTPAFSSMYNTMGTSAPVSEQMPEEDPAVSAVYDGQGDRAEKSGAEIVLENFMEKWRKSIVADMVELTSPAWRAEQDNASQQLYWKFGQKPLVEWSQQSQPTGTEASTARTITVVADVNYNGAVRTYQYDAVVLLENDKWYVDPNSLSSGVLVPKPDPTPDPNATPTPEPTNTPEPTTNPKTKMYYNKNGGSFYHAEPECTSVGKKYLPLASFEFSKLSESPYNKLKPCSECDAPSK